MTLTSNFLFSDFNYKVIVKLFKLSHIIDKVSKLKVLGPNFSLNLRHSISCAFFPLLIWVR